MYRRHFSILVIFVTMALLILSSTIGSSEDKNDKGLFYYTSDSDFQQELSFDVPNYSSYQLRLKTNFTLYLQVIIHSKNSNITLFNNSFGNFDQDIIYTQFNNNQSISLNNEILEYNHKPEDQFKLQLKIKYLYMNYFNKSLIPSFSGSFEYQFEVARIVKDKLARTLHLVLPLSLLSFAWIVLAIIKDNHISSNEHIGDHELELQQITNPTASSLFHQLVIYWKMQKKVYPHPMTTIALLLLFLFSLKYWTYDLSQYLYRNNELINPITILSNTLLFLFHFFILLSIMDFNSNTLNIIWVLPVNRKISSAIQLVWYSVILIIPNIVISYFLVVYRYYVIYSTEIDWLLVVAIFLNLIRLSIFHGSLIFASTVISNNPIRGVTISFIVIVIISSIPSMSWYSLVTSSLISTMLEDFIITTILVTILLYIGKHWLDHYEVI